MFKNIKIYDFSDREKPKLLKSPELNANPNVPAFWKGLVVLPGGYGTLEEVVEPYLIQEGLVLRTPRGRMLGERGWRHLGLAPPASMVAQLDLLRDTDS